MKNSTKLVAPALITAALVAGCSQPVAKGTLDDLRYAHAEWATTNQPVIRRVCKTVTVTRTHTTWVKGKARSTTKTVPTTRCVNQTTGRTSPHRKQVSPERWCLEVGGSWYRVSAADYRRAEGLKLGSKFKTAYRSRGC